MHHLLDECKDLFDSDNLYDILNIKKKATEKEIKKAYHRVSLRVHPDRVEPEEKKLSTHKFQIIGKIYAILSDQDKRALYDESGEIDDDDECISDDRDWNAYWRVLFKPISVKDIKEYEIKYKGSKEEIDDIKESYIECKGSFLKMMEFILFASDDNIGRYQDIIDKAIKNKEIKRQKGHKRITEAQKKKRANMVAKEEIEASELKKELGLDGGDSLSSLIKKRNAARAGEMDSFFDHLANKYGEPEKKRRRKK